MTGGQVEESDLAPLSTLEPELEHFLEALTPMWGARDRWGSLPEPSINNCEVWLEWQAHQVNMPDWWRELVTIPNAGDLKKLVCKICASFEVPQIRCKALKDPGRLSFTPAPKCIQRKMFLPVANSHLPCQEYQLKQPWRTLAYAQALQYWAEKANQLVPNEPWYLVMCVHELRWLMNPYMTFTNCDIFQGLTHEIPEETEVEGAMQPNPIKPSLADGLATLMIIPSAPEDGSAALITTPAIPMEESVVLVTPYCIGRWASQPPTLPEATSEVSGPTELEYPKWIKVHLSHPAASMGSLPSTLGDLKQCHCNCKSSWRKAQHCLVEEQWALGGDSSSALPGSSPELAPQEEEDPGAQPKVPPPGFKEIAKSLNRGKSPEIEINCPLTGASQGLSVGSAVATVMSTMMCKVQTMGAIYWSMVMTSMGLMHLGSPLSGSWPLGANHRRTDRGWPGRKHP